MALPLPPAGPATPAIRLAGMILAEKIRIRLRGYFADRVDELAEGSIVYQDLDSDIPGLGGVFEHSGVHIGDYQIVSLSKSGKVVKESTRKFIEGDGAWNRFIWVSCRGGAAVGDPIVAERARGMVGESRDYNFVLDNCHQFTSGCLTGDFENADNFLTFLETTAGDKLGFDNWRVWDRDGAIQRMCDKAILKIGQDRRLLESLIAADEKERRKLLDGALDGLAKTYAIKDVDGFLDGLGKIAKAYGGQLPWSDFESADEWMLDPANAQVVGKALRTLRRPESGADAAD